MVETDWREILSFSQRELGQTDKEKLCEGLSWMEADDIELNFSDLKILFRLAQDILKYKNEQVNNLLGQLEIASRKGKKKSTKGQQGSPGGTKNVHETIAYQEDLIETNKKILENLNAEIAELEKIKNKTLDAGQDSDSSRDALSEMNAAIQLENEVAMKNRHIRKLLADIKVLEKENTKFKEKTSVLKDKLNEATMLIDNLTEQLLHLNHENTNIKEILGKTEQERAKLTHEIEALKKEFFEKDSSRENIYVEIKTKVQHWKNLAKIKKSELDALSIEYDKLKDDLSKSSKLSSPIKNVQRNFTQEEKMKELQDKLTEATSEINNSANLINILRSENRQLKSILEETQDNSEKSENRNESDEGKERILINKLRKKVKNLSDCLQEAEDQILVRERELAEVSTELQLVQSDEGIKSLLDGLKHKKKEIKLKEDGIKTLVQEVNNYSQQVNQLELENEALRQLCNIPADEKVYTEGVIQKYRELELSHSEIIKEKRKLENNLVNTELINRDLSVINSKLKTLLRSTGYSIDKLDSVELNNESQQVYPENGFEKRIKTKEIPKPQQNEVITSETEIKSIMEENEGLRKGLQEVLNFLKDNSTTSSGILELECPSLEALLLSMEARHTAGWFAPHMSTILELRAAIGGKDALLKALHEARKETYNVLSKLTKETEKSVELERKLQDFEKGDNSKSQNNNVSNTNNIEFGSWIAEKDENINLCNENEITELITKGDVLYESHLKKGLEYFHLKFKALYEKISVMAVQAVDDQNRWSILEEQYKAQIENLKGRIELQEEDDMSENSPGLISPLPPYSSDLQRKCTYLEESYKYIRTLNENIKNENIEAKKEVLTISSNFETEIQRLIISVANLTDRLRSSIPIELFWKLNTAYSENVIKYRKLLDSNVRIKYESTDLFSRLDKDKLDILSHFSRDCVAKKNSNNSEHLLSTIEENILKKQLQELCIELDAKNKKYEDLENINKELQQTQSQIIDNSLASLSKHDVDYIKNQLQTTVDENKILKEKIRHTNNQLEIAQLQVQENQERQMSNDMEINLLRHQILDLQSTSDAKAIVSRLSGEVLVAHLQVTESNKKIERLNSELNREKELRVEAEEMLKARQKIFDVYSHRYESKFRYFFDIMQILRQQYQGSIPLTSVENYLNKTEDIIRESQAVNEKLQEIEDLRSNLMTKHSVMDQILDVSRNKCIIEGDSCPHKIKVMMMKSTTIREVEHLDKKNQIMEQSRDELLKRCNQLEKTLVLVNQGFEISKLNGVVDRKHSDGEIIVSNLDIDDNQSDEDSESRRSKTITLPKPHVLKPRKDDATYNIITTNVKNIQENADLKTVETKENEEHKVKQANLQTADIQVQTVSDNIETKHIAVQTIEDKLVLDLKQDIDTLDKTIAKQGKELSETLFIIQKKTQEAVLYNNEKQNLEATIQTLKSNIVFKEKMNEKLQSDIDEIKNELVRLRALSSENTKIRHDSSNENAAILSVLKQSENDKKVIVTEYKELLHYEREEYSKTIKEINAKNMELQSKLDMKGSDTNNTNSESMKELTSKYTMKIVELEDKCFRLQSNLDECQTQLKTYQSEVDRWKDLAAERLVKMERLNEQLGERHFQEVESYKAENQHWLSQLSDTQREHMELRSRLTDQKALYVKLLSEKDGQLEQMRSIVNSLKVQVVNMQTMISVNDPSFDLSAIVEVEETSDAVSHGSDRLEIKFDTSADVNDINDEFGRIGNSSTTIWQEPVIERLRRDKQMTCKQNGILRRQIKALAARERRARLDAQNLKNQVFRITSGGKVTTAETAALHNKIASLQAQLTSARRDTNSSIALWDKWKRAQQMAERWQARFEEKCQEVKKLEHSIDLSKSAVNRLEREKKVLITRLTQEKQENQLSLVKHDMEAAEKRQRSGCESCLNAPPLSNHALLERVQAQQRRIVALEVAEKGNEVLVSEYEKTLAEITSLKSQVLKLESSLLESQIRTPIQEGKDTQPELDHWKNYCEMLKDENVQLHVRISALEGAPTTTNQHRVNDLEQTVLTLRGLVSKLQSEQKTGYKKPESRPNSGRSVGAEKRRNSIEPLRIENANLKRSIQEKDLLLERSKEMLKIAAEREDDLLRENAYLRRQLEDITQSRQGFQSV